MNTHFAPILATRKGISGTAMVSLLLLLFTFGDLSGQTLPASAGKSGSSRNEPCSPLIERKGSKFRIKGAGEKPIVFEEMRCYPGHIYFRKKGKWGITDHLGRLIAQPQYENVKAFNNGLAQVKRAGKKGYIDEKGREVIPVIYDQIRELRGDQRFLCQSREKWNLVGRNGKPVNAKPYDNVSAFYDGVAVLKSDGRFGLINQYGEVISPPIYDRVNKFFEDLAMVSRDGYWGHINRKGIEQIPIVYDEVFVFYNGLAVARKEGKWGYINKQNEAVIPFEYDHVEYFENDRALVAREGLWGYINPRAEEVIPLKYQRIHPFHNGIAKVELEDKQGYIDYEGRTVIPAIYDEIYRFHDGIAITRNDGKYGYVSDKGARIAPPIYEHVDHFRDGVAKVQQGGLFGMINRENEVVVPIKYDDIGDYRGGMATVKIGQEWVLVEDIYGDDLANIDPAYAARIKIGDEWGYIDQSGRAFGFRNKPIEFIDERADLGTLSGDEEASFNFHFRNNGERSVRLTDVKVPCGCEAYYSTEQNIRPSGYGELAVICKPTTKGNDWKVRIPVTFSNGQENVLVMTGDRLRSGTGTKEELINGKYVFLLDISASMDELPLAKMIFSKLAASLCRNDNISIVSFNSFSKLELNPTQNHSEVVSTIRQLRPSLKTDAARGLRLSYKILEERSPALERHIYMASDGDIDSVQLSRIQADHAGLDAILTIFVFSYTGDETAFDRLQQRVADDNIRLVYVDRENITQVLNQEYTDIGCLSPDIVVDSLRYKRIAYSDDGRLGVFEDQRRLGIVDANDNLLLPAIYDEIGFANNGLIRARGDKGWLLFDDCLRLTPEAYDSIGTFEFGKALAFRDGDGVLLDKLGREYDYIPELHGSTYYENPLALAGQPYNNMTLLLDISSSMNSPEKLPLLKETFSHFSGLLRYEDSVSIVSYTDDAVLQLKATTAARRQTILETIDNLNSRGATEVLSGLQMAYDEASRHFIDDGNNRVILATDGKFEESEALFRLLERYRNKGIHLSIFLFGKREQPQFAAKLSKLAEFAEGSYTFIHSDNIKEVMLREALVKN